jgi:hypothetical protein
MISIKSFYPLLLIFILSCGQDRFAPVVIKTEPGSILNFAGFTTNDEKEILHNISHFPKTYIGADTAKERIVHRYLVKNNLLRFYTTEDRSLYEQSQVDLASLSLSLGFPFEKPLVFTFWKQSYSGTKGKWQVDVDTTFTLHDSTGQEHRLSYRFSATGYDRGMTEVYVPEDRFQPYQVLRVEWDPFQSTLYDHTSGDSLLIQKGTQNLFYEPRLGMIRMLSDYTLEEKGASPVPRKSTWELMSVDSPPPVR